MCVCDYSGLGSRELNEQSLLTICALHVEFQQLVCAKKKNLEETVSKDLP